MDLSRRDFTKRALIGSIAFPEEIAGRLRQIEAAHAVLGVPGYVGQVMRIPGR